MYALRVVAYAAFVLLPGVVIASPAAGQDAGVSRGPAHSTTTRTKTTTKATTKISSTTSARTTTSATPSTTTSKVSTAPSSTASSGPCTTVKGASGCTYNVYCNSDYTGSEYGESAATSLEECAAGAYNAHVGAFTYYPGFQFCYLSEPNSPGNVSKLRADPESGNFAGIAAQAVCYNR